MKFGAFALIGAASAFSETEQQFIQYIADEGKLYGTDAEYKFRLAQFEKRVAEHKRWNSIPRQTSI